MATLTSSASHSSQTPFPDLLQPILNAFTAWRTEQRERARIARELATYTDRELFDLRIQRADFQPSSTALIPANTQGLRPRGYP